MRAGRLFIVWWKEAWRMPLPGANSPWRCQLLVPIWKISSGLNFISQVTFMDTETSSYGLRGEALFISRQNAILQQNNFTESPVSGLWIGDKVTPETSSKTASELLRHWSAWSLLRVPEPKCRNSPRRRSKECSQKMLMGAGQNRLILWNSFSDLWWPSDNINLAGSQCLRNLLPGKTCCECC